MSLTHAAKDVLAERLRHLTEQGHTPEKDDQKRQRGELAEAAACYARVAQGQALGLVFDKPMHDGPWDYLPGTQRENLVIAGSLILAEIERLDRAEIAKHQSADLFPGAAVAEVVAILKSVQTATTDPAAMNALSETYRAIAQAAMDEATKQIVASLKTLQNECSALAAKMRNSGVQPPRIG